VIVVDLGCYDPPGGYNSLEALRKAFAPDLLFGFDPQATVRDEMIAGTQLQVRQLAAWTRSGDVGFEFKGTESHTDDKDETVPCFDFSEWLSELGQPAVVKMDIEGAEYELLDKMRADRTDRFVDLLLIEWHDEPIETGIPTETWWN